MATGGSSIYKAGHEEYFEYACTPCKDEGRNSEALKFCENCSHYLCTKCYKEHGKFPALRNHKVLDVAAMSGLGPQPAKFIPTEPCPSHQGGLIDTYCGDHDDVCCPTCVALNHRSCTDIDYLPIVAKGIKKSKEYTSIMQGMVKVKSQLESLKKLKQDDKKRLEEDMSVCLTKIKDYRTALNKKLDDLEKAAEDEVRFKHQEYEARLKKDINNLEQMVSSLEASIDQLEKSNADNEPRLFVSVKMGKKDITDGNKLAQEMQAGTRQNNLNFQVNKGIEEYISTLKSLADFPLETQNAVRYTASFQKTQDAVPYTASFQKTQDAVPYTASFQKTQDAVPYTASFQKTQDAVPYTASFQNTQDAVAYTASSQKTQDAIHYTAALLGKYDVKVGGESRCNILGSCLLDDNTLLIADYDNDNIKRLNSSYKVIDHIKMPGNPWAVCATGTAEAAVALDQQIQFVSLGSKMTLTRSINVGENCLGVAYSNGELFVSFVGGYMCPGWVMTYSTAGKLLRTVRNDATGLPIFSMPGHIAVSTDGSAIHVADDKEGVIILDRQGEKQSQFSDPKLRGTSGVCQGDNDQLFVCGNYSNNILQFSKSGQMLAILLDSSHGVKSPSSICYDPARTRLIVTMDGSSYITVYNLTRK